MKKFIYTIVFVLIANHIVGQSFKAEESDIFDGNVGRPALMMKDGTTIFQFDDVKKRKMFLTIFDKDHHVIINNKEMNFKTFDYKYRFTDERSSNVSFWTEEKGKAVIYMEANYKACIVTLDPKTAQVENEEPIDNVSRVYSSALRTKSMDHYFIEKESVDPITGNRYKVEKSKKQLTKEEALATKDFSTLAAMTFVIYNPAGKEIKRIPFDFVEKKYQDGYIVSTLFYNNILYFVSEEYKMYDRATYDAPFTGKGKVGSVYFSKLDISSGKFKNQELLELKDEIAFENCKVIPNDDHSVFNLRFFIKTGHSNGNIAQDPKAFYAIFFQSIDPQTLETGTPYYLPDNKLNDYVKSNCKIDEGFQGGMLDKCISDKNGNLLTAEVKNATGLSELKYEGVYTANPEMIGVSYFDKAGKEIAGFAYRYDVKNIINVYSLEDPVDYSKNNFSYVLAAGSKNCMIFLNNSTDNFNLPADKKPDYVSSLEDCNALAIEFMPDGTTKQYYVFGEPANKKANKYVDFSSAVYDEKTNTIIVKLYEGSGYKKSRAAWIKVN